MGAFWLHGLGQEFSLGFRVSCCQLATAFKPGPWRSYLWMPGLYRGYLGRFRSNKNSEAIFLGGKRQYTTVIE